MLCPEEYVLLVTAAGLSLTKGKNLEELAVLSGIFSQLSCVISAVAIQQGYIESVCSNKNGSETIQELL